MNVSIAGAGGMIGSAPETHTLQALPANSAWARELCERGMRKHYITSLVELDVTAGRRSIRDYKKKTGGTLSFFAWITKCIADAIDLNKAVHACRYKRQQVLIFDDVDISIPIERELNGKRMPMPYVLRSANKKTLHQIHGEIETARHKALAEEEQVLSKPVSALLLRFFPSFPRFIKNAFWNRFDRDPFIQKRIMGTVGITSVAVAGRMTGWALPITIQPVCFALGSVTKRTEIIRDKPEVHDYLAMTIMFDHDVIDGAPAARFVSQLSRMISSAHACPG